MMKLFKNFAFIVSAFSMLLLAKPANAGTGQSIIDIVITQFANVTNITDLTITPWAGSGDATGEHTADICVYSSTGGYSILISDTVVPGTGASDDTLNLGSASTNQALAYSLRWADDGSTYQDFTAFNTAITGLVGGDDSSCTTGNKASFDITIAESALQAVDDGTYSSTVTFTVSPT